jgi:hypothetical protein
MRPYRSKPDNSGLYMLVMIVASFALTAFGIWAIVEFILYLVKDDPFNKLSLWLTIGAFVTEIICFFKFATSD